MNNLKILINKVIFALSVIKLFDLDNGSELL